MNNTSMRDAFFDELYEIALQKKNIIVISADMGAPSLDKFRRDLGAQFVNIGIAEQNMVNVATGLSLEGKKVFVYAIMPFATLRCYEVTKVNLSLMNIPVTIVGVGAGFSYDDSGPTHHATEDIAAMRALPNMTILNASDSFMAAEFAEMSCHMSGPNYVRLDREVLPIIYSRDSNFGDGLTSLKAGKDVCIIATGNMVHIALEAARKLEAQAVNTGVIDLYRLKPINAKLLLKSLGESKRIVTLEEHMLSGGMGSAVTEVMADNGRTLPIKRIAIPDRYYYAYGGRKNIQSLCGLDADSVTATISAWL
jgi:transketolase